MNHAEMKILQKQVMREIASKLKSLGFNLKAAEQAFYCTTENGWVAFHISFIEHLGIDFDLTADVAIRINAVEDMINANNKLLTKKEKSQTATIGCELGNLAQGNQRRWTISSDKDILLVTEQITSDLLTIGLPYIEKYSDLHSIWECLSSNSPDVWKESPAHAGRCKRALVLTILLGKDELVGNIIQQSEEFLKKMSDIELKWFQQFVKELQILEKIRV